MLELFDRSKALNKPLFAKLQYFFEVNDRNRRINCSCFYLWANGDKLVLKIALQKISLNYRFYGVLSCF